MFLLSVREPRGHVNAIPIVAGEARRDSRPIVITHHGKPHVLIQPISEDDLEALGWGELAKLRLEEAWQGEDEALYDYL